MIFFFKFKVLFWKIIYFLNYLFSIPKTYFKLHFDPLVNNQLQNLDEIPVIIINYNQLYYLRDNIKQLKKYGFKKIVIIDNHSSYPELLKYYDEIEGDRQIDVIRLKDNTGHMVLYKKMEIFQDYCKGFYFLTDADIVLSDTLPSDFRNILLHTLLENYYFTTKAGVALDVSDIPDAYPLKNKVLSWEKKFWTKPYKKDFYRAEIDTTFALYKPGYQHSRFSDFTRGIRIAGDFTSKHGGWYLDPENFSDEQKFYFKDNISTSWIFNQDGSLIESKTNSTY